MINDLLELASTKGTIVYTEEQSKAMAIKTQMIDEALF